ncbi:sugar MFS transporter [SAR92 clade bacterium H231]|jgi:FHS family L-fucose permease-like MFS transporter|nr:sugar MFS transporter [Porticoccaceae bacterium]MCT2532532.1 sugar MFS transporter [SAR92 clade bacterium H231]MBT7257426.1 sugar MFS transporter [Porticoccaceae bacterium]MBT7904040.1 sugar MFS transporter [Porticoccaceae bacterium]MDB2479685.1 sugar MFS transporter [Porticoccaceae bacterium]
MAGSASGNSTAAAGGQEPGTQTFAFIAMTCLFFFWGFITVLNDILIPFLKESFDLNYTQAMLVQFCFFGAYFIVSPFAGKLIDKVGYQQGIVLGLLTTATGCVLFYPSASLNVYALFLFSFFVLASGITILQVAANPYVAALGPETTAASRLNLAQAANSLGTTVGPIVGATLILGVVAADASAVQGPYLMIAALLVIAALVFRRIKLPVLAHVETTEEASAESIWNRRSLVLGALAIFLYVGGEVSIGSFLVNYFSESSIAGMSAVDAGEMVAYYWGAAMVGRLVGAWLMNYIAATKYLAINSVIAVLMIVVSMNTTGDVAMWSILAVGFFNSIMFPTIFTLAVKGLGSLTSKGSGLVCQAIVGGALVPLVQGAAADIIGIQMSFIVPMLCYIYIGWYALRGADQN